LTEFRLHVGVQPTTFPYNLQKGAQMALSAELSAEIDKMIVGMKKSDYRRAGTGINDFINAYSSLLAQTEKDIPSLTGAGFDSSKMPRYQGYLELLLLTLGDRRGVAPNAEEKKVFFDQQLVLAELDKKRLMIVCSYIAEFSTDKAVRRSYKEIAKGSGIIDTLCDNLACVSMIRENPELASQIKPGGIEITEEYCAEVSKRAVELLMLKGFVVSQGVPENIMVDRQNRIITLCMDAISEIRRFAKAAFFDDLDYYNNNYASLFRQQSSDPDDVPDEEPKTVEKVMG
jgi:hypothetical protein